MRVLDPGHKYALRNLVGGGQTVLQFYKDPSLHDGDGYDGPSCQEVLRAVIDRVQELDRERHWEGNATIIYDLRHAIAGFEARAMLRRVEKDSLPIETLPLAEDGHVLLAHPEASPPSLGVEELTGAVERVTEAFNDMRDGGSTPDTEQEMLDHLPTVLRGVSTLREALEPFACLAVADDRMDGLDPDQLRASVVKAREALSRVSGGV